MIEREKKLESGSESRVEENPEQLEEAIKIMDTYRPDSKEPSYDALDKLAKLA